MMRLLANWKGSVIVNGKEYKSIADVPALTGDIHIELKSAVEKKPVVMAQTKTISIITVKKYMTEKATPMFDFMAKWNKDIPMPLRTMVAEKVKETAGMVYMKCHGDIWTRQICTCMKCGRVLTNPVSQFFGIGPECGGHNYVSPFETDAELQEAVSAYKKKLQAITWEGWIIKSAITSCEEVQVEEG